MAMFTNRETGGTRRPRYRRHHNQRVGFISLSGAVLVMWLRWDRAKQRERERKWVDGGHGQP